MQDAENWNAVVRLSAGSRRVRIVHDQSVDVPGKAFSVQGTTSSDPRKFFGVHDDALRCLTRSFLWSSWPVRRTRWIVRHLTKVLDVCNGVFAGDARTFFVNAGTAGVNDQDFFVDADACSVVHKIPAKVEKFLRVCEKNLRNRDRTCPEGTFLTCGHDFSSRTCFPKKPSV